MSEIPVNNGPLKGVRIVDMTSVVFGPYGTRILADLGAEVIKIESNGGDILRYAGAPIPAMGPVHLALNRNKESVDLDLTNPRAREAFNKMLAGADAFISNVRLPALERLGVGYEDVKAIKEDIVYVHCSGFDSAGPYGELAAYDDLVQAGSGMTDLISRVNDDGSPRYIPAIMADKVSGLHLAYAAMAALFHHERTGEGQFVEVPMLESTTSFNLVENMFGNTYIPQVGPVSYPRSIDINRKPFKSKDGYVSIMPYSDEHWVTFFEMAGRKDMLDDPRFADFSSRTQNITLLYKAVSDIAPSRTSKEWFEILNEAGVPCMKVNTLDDIREDEHFKATGFFEQREHPDIGPYYVIKHPVRFEKTPAAIYKDAPTLGRDTVTVLERLGYSEEEIDEILKGSSSDGKNRHAKSTLT
jgi:crotonobetainyl-CoA:carnitine CoA-transferase CaiB-like acyl-CoA transferase